MTLHALIEMYSFGAAAFSKQVLVPYQRCATCHPSVEWCGNVYSANKEAEIHKHHPHVHTPTHARLHIKITESDVLNSHCLQQDIKHLKAVVTLRPSSV